jgi:hypothetical protein
MWGLFIHFFSDVLTSLIVLGVGLAYHYETDNHWYKTCCRSSHRRRSCQFGISMHCYWTILGWSTMPTQQPALSVY